MMKLFLVAILATITRAQDFGSDGTLVNSNGQNGTTNSNEVVEDVVFIPDIPYVAQPPIDYARAMAMSMLFYEAQRSGKLPEDHRVKWRGDSGMTDGSDNGVDLTGGYYDGASYVKYGFSMASMTTVLSWGVIRYRRTYEILGQLDYALQTIKWATDYFIKCHTSPYEFYGQVGDKPSDSQYMGRPEDMNYPRNSYKITRSNPGSDLAAETAAALAAASIVFQPTNETYAAILKNHAEQLYQFGQQYRGIYSRSIPQAEQAYQSNKDVDEMAWGAGWLYKLTGKMTYLRDAERFYDKGKLGKLVTEFSWRDKSAGVQVLLAELTNKKKFKKSSQWFCEHSQAGKKRKFHSQSRYTPEGLLWINVWGPLRYAANTAFLCLTVADLGINVTANREFAANQINYMLGMKGKPFVVGFDENSPTHPYHKSSYCPSPPDPCPPFKNEVPNAHILYGALVGGPSEDDSFRDERSNEEQNSVTLDFNAGFQSSLAGLLDIYIYGPGPKSRPHIDKPGQITVDSTTLPKPTSSAPTTATKFPKATFVDLLNKTLYFYEAQKSGPLNRGQNRVSWRGSSGLTDGSDINANLTRGFYTTGSSYVKYNLPISWSMTMLAWSLIEYEDAYRYTRQYSRAYNLLKWGMDYIENCHLSGLGLNTSLVGQVGNPASDPQTWDIPERMDGDDRPSFVLSPEQPGSEIAAEVAASMSAASIVFRSSNRLMSDRLFNRSRFIFSKIALEYPGVYTDGITSAAEAYPSSGYRDELAWASAWLDQRQRHLIYFNKIKDFASTKLPRDFSYDNKTAGVQLLMGIRSFDFTQISTFCNWLISDAPRTQRGLLYLSDRYPAQYAANAAFILLLTFEKNKKHYNSRKWRDFGVAQIEMLIGSGGQSFVVGYGPNYPKQPHHKASSCPGLTEPCGFAFKESDSPNPQELIGALVGGPSEFGYFVDNRQNIDQLHVSMDGNAGFHASIAALIHLKITNQLGNAAAHVLASHSLVVLLAAVVFHLTLALRGNCGEI